MNEQLTEKNRALNIGKFNGWNNNSSDQQKTIRDKIEETAQYFSIPPSEMELHFFEINYLNKGWDMITCIKKPAIK